MTSVFGLDSNDLKQVKHEVYWGASPNKGNIDTSCYHRESEAASRVQEMVSWLVSTSPGKKIITTNFLRQKASSISAQLRFVR